MTAPDDQPADDEPDAETAFGPTFKEQLVKARRGQGVFRSSVLLSERQCRVTRVSDPKHLRASHIKPWSGCASAYDAARSGPYECATSVTRDSPKCRRTSSRSRTCCHTAS